MCNEPASGVRRWADVSTSLAKKLRHITDKPITLCTPNGHVKHLPRFARLCERKEIDNLIYQAHFYHSGRLNEKIIKRQLREVRKTARRGYEVYIGEVGSNVEKNSPEYIAEFFQITLGLLERWGCHWTVHAYNESRLFNYEDTPAMEVIESFKQLR